MKNSIKRFIKDIIPVLLGVLIALWINNWNEARKDRNYIHNFYASLKQELSDTDKEITLKTPNQKVLLDTLDAYADNNSLTLIEVIEKGGGVNGPNIKLNYWKAISNSKIELIDYKKLSLLADLEEGNELLNYKRNKLIDFIYANLTKTGQEEKVIMRIMMEEMVRTQLGIQEDIQKFLQK